MQARLNVLIAGAGGASLGTELIKCLALAGRYSVSACDISPAAYGLYDETLASAHVVDRDAYIESVLEVCRAREIAWVIPGGEQPLALLTAAEDALGAAGVRVLANTRRVTGICSDKSQTFTQLAALGVASPRTLDDFDAATIEQVGMPCIVKPATGTGGSAMVFFATNAEEALIYADYIRRGGGLPIAQEYINESEGEFTVGVLSDTRGKVLSSVALRRRFDNKLSVSFRGRGGLVSSGYSQGYIDDFAEIRQQCEKIAVAIDSRGPINVQGRLRDGKLIPFEINPRLSASSYLRALAGINEVDLFLRAEAFGEAIEPAQARAGWYLRSLAERYVAPGDLQQ